MEEEERLCRIEQTELFARIQKIRAIYETLKEGQARFCNRFDVHCKSGCGACCEHFIPDLTQAEAEFMAYGLMTEGRDDTVLQALAERDRNSPVCPLYDPTDAMHHCTVYEWRPLICRLFGAAASENKDGHPVYRNCKWNENGHDVTAERLDGAAEDVVCMDEYGMMLQEAEPGKAETVLLPEALERAVAEIRLIEMLESQENP